MRVVNPPEKTLSRAPFKTISPSVIELDLELTHPLVEKLFCQGDNKNVPAPQRSFVSWFEVRRCYSAEEMEEASYFFVNFRRTFVEYSEGEKTLWDESMACTVCGFGRVQVGPMILPKLPIRRPPIVRLGNGAIIVSETVAESLKSFVLEDITLQPVKRSIKEAVAGNANIEITSSSDAIQLMTSRTARISRTTYVGVNPYSKKPDPFRCPLGHTLGTSLLGELQLDELPDSNFSLGAPAIGGRSGLFWPIQPLIISKAARSMLPLEVKYVDFEPLSLRSIP